MKSIKKYLFMLMALAAVFGFVACSNDDDDDGPSTVAVYKATTTGVDWSVTYTAKFFEGGTFAVDSSSQGNSITAMTGTYTGDPSKDGEITMTVKKIAGEDGKLADPDDDDFASPITVTITGGKANFLDMGEFTRQ